MSDEGELSQTPVEAMKRLIAERGITMEARYRGCEDGEGELLNISSKIGRVSELKLLWGCTLSVGNRHMHIEFRQGSGHLPKGAYEKLPSGGLSLWWESKLRTLLVTGRRLGGEDCGIRYPAVELTPPALHDVLWCAVRDADVLDYKCFEDWADEFGYDRDSRKAEQVYRECMKQTLELRALVGQDFINLYSEASQDY